MMPGNEATKPHTHLSTPAVLSHQQHGSPRSYPRRSRGKRGEGERGEAPQQPLCSHHLRTPLAGPPLASQGAGRCLLSFSKTLGFKVTVLKDPSEASYRTPPALPACAGCSPLTSKAEFPAFYHQSRLHPPPPLAGSAGESSLLSHR